MLEIKRKLILITIFFAGFLQITKGQIPIIGPMLHVNFGNKKVVASIGIEASLWFFSLSKIPSSIDVGIEIDIAEVGKARTYFEFQTFLPASPFSKIPNICGASIGLVREKTESTKEIKFGVQGSVWDAWFGGVDLRYRHIDGTNYISPGTFFKNPLN